MGTLSRKLAFSFASSRTRIAPRALLNEITRAANTQNRIEKRDFAALDSNQKRLRTELYLENQKEYAYQTGEQPPQGE